MEKHTGVFERFYDFENLYGGYLLARKNKRFKPEVLSYSAHREDELIDAQNHLVWQDLVVKGIHSFYEYFPKVRLIHALPFRYRVINCAAYRVLWPIYARSFYEHSYGSIPGMGQVKACDQMQRWIRWVRSKPGQWYIGKMDIQKFFFRVPIEVQLRELMKPLDDVRVRKALCYAVDVDALLTLTADGHGSKLGSSIYPSFKKYFDESLVNAYPYSESKAKELLTEAGYPNGFDLVITVPSNYTPHVNVGLALAEQLKKIGINASVQEVEWNTWLTDVYQGRKFQATVCGFDASTLTAGALLGRYESTSSKNMCGYQSAEFDRLMAEANASTDDAVRTASFRAASKCLSDDAVNVYLQDLADFVAMNKNLSGYHFYPIYVIDFSTLTY